VRNSINSIYKMHSSYLTVHNYYDFNSGVDSVDILSVSYTKTFSQRRNVQQMVRNATKSILHLKKQNVRF